MRIVTPGAVSALVVGSLLAPSVADAQEMSALNRGSSNVEVIGHLPLGPRLSVADVELEQEVSRPYAYVARMVYGDNGDKGTDIISIADPSNPKVLYRWRIDNQDLHQRTGGMDVKYFKHDDRYYVVQSLQFGQGGPDADLGAVILDVTGLPDPSTVEKVAELRAPERPGGFHNIFVYKHSNGTPLLFVTTSGPSAYVYNLAEAVDGDPSDALAGEVPVPPGAISREGGSAYHDFYVGYHPATGQDRFYGGGAGGYYIYDITNLADPQLRTSITGVSGVNRGHTFTPTPDGNFAVGETEYQYAPLRIYDLRPGLTGEVPTIRSSVGAWTADWHHLSHNHEVRYPFVFVSGYLDGFQVFNMQDPTDPKTVAYYDTYLGPPNTDRYSQFNGAFGVDIRNEDGLIVVSDMSTGFWVFRMDGFQGWHGADWGMPNISSAQDWERGPTYQPRNSPTGEEQ
ncbi:MAG TPA: hypothetical protein VFI91_14455 [Longimicrobiaceae bacterium]|nr:hypothetical protein [Longimicrobiaceae bacterium]